MSQAQDNPQEKLSAFVGTWIGEDTIFPAPWAPHGGSGVTTYTGALSLDGRFVIGDDVQKRPGQPDYLAHKVFGFDPAEGVYTFHLFDSTGQNPAQPARGRWEGENLTLEQATPMGRLRFSYTFAAEDRYVFRMFMSRDGEHWVQLIEGSYRRQ
ncbi:MAG: DUF1579 family protein [Meiothermus sp.]|nr:DUF1579 family protein [Meiothermus sp.]